MARKTLSGNRLFELYVRYVAEPESVKHVYGYWLLTIGYVAGFAGVAVFVLAPPLTVAFDVFDVRRAGIVLSALGLSLALFGIVLMLPVRRRGVQTAIVGLLVALVGIGWFVTIYPEHWWVTTPDYSSAVIAVYSVGIALVAGVAVLVPIATGKKSYFFETPQLGESEEPPVLIGEANRGALFSVFRNGGEWTWRLIDQSALAGGTDGFLSRLETEERVEHVKERVEEAGLFEIRHAAFRLYQATEGRWRWVLMREDGGVVADSGDEFDLRDAAEESVNVLKEYGPDADVLVVEDAAFECYEEGGRWHWRLVDSTRTPLAHGDDPHRDRSDAEDELHRFSSHADAPVLVVESLGVELYEDDGWRYRLCDVDDETIARSTAGIESRDAAEEAVYDLLERLSDAVVLADEPAYEVYEAGPNAWRFRLVTADDVTVARSPEPAGDRNGPEAAARRMLTHVAEAPVIEIDTDAFEVYEWDGRWHWRQVDERRRLLARSTTGYETREEGEAAVEALRRKAVAAELIEFEGVAFRLYEADETWRWRLVDEDGNVMADSGQGDYSSRDDAASAMFTLKEHAPDAEPIEIETAAFELFEADDGWNWRLVDRTGETIAEGGGGRPSRDGAHDAMTKLVDRAEDSDRRTLETAAFDVYSDGEEWRWRFVHADGTILAESETGYATRHETESAIEDVRDDAETASIAIVGRLAIELVSEGEGWRWRLVDAERTVVAEGESTYGDRDGVEAAVEWITAHAVEATVFEIRDAAFLLTRGEDGWRYWLLDESHERVAVGGERYETRDEAERALADVKSVVGDAPLLDVENAAFELYEEEDGWYWRLIDEDRSVVAAGTEAYDSREATEVGVETIKREVGDASILEIERAAFELHEAGGEWRWRLIDENGNHLADSLATYPSRREAREGLNAVKTYAPKATTTIAE